MSNANEVQVQADKIVTNDALGLSADDKNAVNLCDVDELEELKSAIEYAMSQPLQKKERGLAAVKQNGLALKFVSEELKKDHEVVCAAVEQNDDALVFKNEEKSVTLSSKDVDSHKHNCSFFASPKNAATSNVELTPQVTINP